MLERNCFPPRTHSFNLPRSSTSRCFERRANNIVHRSPFTHGAEINHRLVDVSNKSGEGTSSVKFVSGSLAANREHERKPRRRKGFASAFRHKSSGGARRRQRRSPRCRSHKLCNAIEPVARPPLSPHFARFRPFPRSILCSIMTEIRPSMSHVPVIIFNLSRPTTSMTLNCNAIPTSLVLSR